MVRNHPAGGPRPIVYPRLISAILVITLSFLSSCFHTPDSVLSKEFRTKRQLFDKLAQMMLADGGEIVIWPGNSYYRRPERVSVERWNAYQKIIEELGVDHASSNAGKQVLITVDHPSLLHGEVYKGYFYSEAPISPSLVRPHLDGFRPRREDAYRGYTVYKKLEGSWYLYYALV